MTATHAIFLLFGALTLGAGIWLAVTRNIVHAAFLFFMVLFGTAALFVFAGAEFLAVSQIIIYVGGILIVMLFGVMLTHKLREAKPETRIINLVPGLLTAGAILVGLSFMIVQFSKPETSTIETLYHSEVKEVIQTPSIWLPMESHEVVQEVNDVEIIGKQTITEYLLPFEVVSILLLVALIGAAYISRKGKEAPDG